MQVLYNAKLYNLSNLYSEHARQFFIVFDREEQKIDLLTAAEDLLDCGLRTLRCTYLGRRRNERVVGPAAAFISADAVRAHSRPLLFTAIRLHFCLRRVFTVARAFPFFHMYTHTNRLHFPYLMRRAKFSVCLRSFKRQKNDSAVLYDNVTFISYSWNMWLEYENIAFVRLNDAAIVI